MKKSNAIPGFHAVEFMRNARKRLTEKYQKDPEGFFKEIDESMDKFLKLREQLQHKKAV